MYMCNKERGREVLVTEIEFQLFILKSMNDLLTTFSILKDSWLIKKALGNSHRFLLPSFVIYFYLFLVIASLELLKDKEIY